jgi:hypothetical protein
MIRRLLSRQSQKRHETMPEFAAETGTRVLKCALMAAWDRSAPHQPTTIEILDAVDEFAEIVKDAVRRGDATDELRDAVARKLAEKQP